MQKHSSLRYTIWDLVTHQRFIQSVATNALRDH